MLKKKTRKIIKKSTISKTGVFTGLLAVFLTTFIALNANSLALWADWAATLMDFLAIFVAWRSFKKVETESAEQFNYGYGKFESFSSFIMAILMVISFFCIIIVAAIRFNNPVQVNGIGVIIGIGAHSVFAIINGGLFFKSWQMEKSQKSSLITAQRRLYLIKFSANLLMISCLFLSYFLRSYEWTLYADPVTATIIALLILANATKIFRHSSRDLLDYALEEPYQLLILRSLANHYHHYENISDIRTRVSGGKIYVEIFLIFEGELPHSEIMSSIESIGKEITDLLKCDEVLVIPVSE